MIKHVSDMLFKIWQQDLKDDKKKIKTKQEYYGHTEPTDTEKNLNDHTNKK